MIDIVGFLVEKYPLKATYSTEMERLLEESFEDEISEDEFLKGYKHEKFLDNVINNSTTHLISFENENPLDKKQLLEKLNSIQTISDVVLFYDNISELDIVSNEEGDYFVR